MKEIGHELMVYMGKAWGSVHPFLLVVWSFVVWVIFPNQAFKTVAMVLMICVFIDVATRIVANVKNKRKITSNGFWDGFRPKAIAFGILLVLCGLSWHLNDVISPIGKWFAIGCYTAMFIREVKSIKENLEDAGNKEITKVFSIVDDLFGSKLKELIGIEVKWFERREKKAQNRKKK